MIATETFGDRMVIALNGRIDSANASAVEKTIMDHVAAGASRVVLDFSNLDYISSAGLRIVLILAKRLKQTGGRLAVYGFKPNIHSLFEVSGFLPLLTVCASQADALEKVSA